MVLNCIYDRVHQLVCGWYHAHFDYPVIIESMFLLLSGIADLRRFWLSCLGPLFFFAPKTLNYMYLVLQSFDYECTWWMLFQKRIRTWWTLFQKRIRTWWRLFQKRVVRTKVDIYVFIRLRCYEDVWQSIHSCSISKCSYCTLDTHQESLCHLKQYYCFIL
jgi:hypothetical protein